MNVDINIDKSKIEDVLAFNISNKRFVHKIFNNNITLKFEKTFDSCIKSLCWSPIKSFLFLALYNGSVLIIDEEGSIITNINLWVNSSESCQYGKIHIYLILVLANHFISFLLLFIYIVFVYIYYIYHLRYHYRYKLL
jgi:hypothetical protein